MQRAFLTLMLGFFVVTPATPEVINVDIGGKIGTYVDKYNGMRRTGEALVINGPCLSGCTLFLGILPRSQVCTTERGVLGFHEAWVPGANGRPEYSSEGTQALWDIYPQHVRVYLVRNYGGLQQKMRHVRASTFVRMCDGGGTSVGPGPLRILPDLSPGFARR